MYQEQSIINNCVDYMNKKNLFEKKRFLPK